MQLSNPLFRIFLFLFFLYVPLSAQWTIKTKKIRFESKDGYVRLYADFPVIVDKHLPKIRKAINYDLGQTSEVDRLIAEAKAEILSHESVTKPSTLDLGDTENFPWSYSFDYSVGINNKFITSIGLNFRCQVGGAVTGYSYFRGCTYDNRTGTSLSLDDLLLDDYDSKLIELFVEYLQPISDDLFDNWKTSIKETNYSFYIDSDAFVFVFPKYSIGPGYMATINIKVPFAKFVDILNPKSPLAVCLKK